MSNVRLERVLLSRAVRIMQISGHNGGEIYGLNLARACEVRYGFLQSPRTLEDFDLNKGVTFLHGYFENRVVIDRFQVFQNGIVVEAKIDTGECDAFLDDVLGWLRQNGGLRANEKPESPRFYSSDLEVQGSFSLAKKLPQLNELGQDIADKLREYGQEPSVDYELVGLLYAPGSGAVPSFRFERRSNAPDEARLYYSTAPLQTNDHLTLLKRIEAILTD